MDASIATAVDGVRRQTPMPTERMGDTVFLRWAALFAAVSLGISPLNFVLAGVVGYSFSPAVTASLLATFPLLAITVLVVGRVQEASIRFNAYVCGWMLCLLSATWFLTYANEAAPSIIDGYYRGTLTAYDFKRPFFFVFGVLFMGSVGCMASRYGDDFIKPFLKSLFGLSIVVSALYIMTYRQGSDSIRLGGDAGLSIGILLSEGLLSGVALSFIYQRVRLIWLCAVPMILVGIAFSGTRAALVSVAVGAVVGAAMRPRLAFSYAKILLPLLVVCLIAVYLGGFIPEATIERLTTFRLTGSQDRWALVALGYDSFMENPFGKVTGYASTFPAGIEYAHNTILQIVMEGGAIAVVPFAVLVMMALVGTRNALSSDAGRGFLIFAASVFTHSLSSGDAYTYPVWFSILFLATLGAPKTR